MQKLIGIFFKKVCLFCFLLGFKSCTRLLSGFFMKFFLCYVMLCFVMSSGVFVSVGYAVLLDGIMSRVRINFVQFVRSG